MSSPLAVRVARTATHLAVAALAAVAWAADPPRPDHGVALAQKVRSILEGVARSSGSSGTTTIERSVLVSADRDRPLIEVDVRTPLESVPRIVDELARSGGLVLGEARIVYESLSKVTTIRGRDGRTRRSTSGRLSLEIPVLEPTAAHPADAVVRAWRTFGTTLSAERDRFDDGSAPLVDKVELLPDGRMSLRFRCQSPSMLRTTLARLAGLGDRTRGESLCGDLEVAITRLPRPDRSILSVEVQTRLSPPARTADTIVSLDALDDLFNALARMAADQPALAGNGLPFHTIVVRRPLRRPLEAALVPVEVCFRTFAEDLHRALGMLWASPRVGLDTGSISLAFDGGTLPCRLPGIVRALPPARARVAYEFRGTGAPDPRVPLSIDAVALIGDLCPSDTTAFDAGAMPAVLRGLWVQSDGRTALHLEAVSTDVARRLVNSLAAHRSGRFTCPFPAKSNEMLRGPRRVFSVEIDLRIGGM